MGDDAAELPAEPAPGAPPGAAPALAPSWGIAPMDVLPNVFAKDESLPAIFYLFDNSSTIITTDTTRRDRVFALAAAALTAGWIPQLTNFPLRTMWAGAMMTTEAKARTLGLILHEMGFRPASDGGSVTAGTLAQLVPFDLAQYQSAIDADLTNINISCDGQFLSSFANLAMLGTYSTAVETVSGRPPLMIIIPPPRGLVAPPLGGGGPTGGQYSKLKPS